MQSLQFADIPDATLGAIARRHGLRAVAFARLPQAGVIHAIYALGSAHILRVPREHADTIAQARTEAIAAPAARAAEVRRHAGRHRARVGEEGAEEPDQGLGPGEARRELRATLN